MSMVPNDAETQVDETQGTQNIEEIQRKEAAEGDSEKEKAKGKKEKKEPILYVHEVGRTVLPYSRVQKILKADEELPMVAREASFLISLAAEEFIKRFMAEGQKVANREGRATVQHRDMAIAVRKIDEFLFMEELVPWVIPESQLQKQPKPKKDKKGKKGTTTETPAAEGEKKDDKKHKTTGTQKKLSDSAFTRTSVQDADIMMNEDGTMETQAEGTNSDEEQ